MARGEELMERYVEATLEMIDDYGETAWAEAGRLDAVYLGGGTPTTLGAKRLGRILGALNDRFIITRETEFTVESSVEKLTPEVISAMAINGVNRVSIGVQTFDTRQRRSLGRISDRETIEKLFDSKAISQIPLKVIDLIYNLPGQKVASFERDLETLFSLRIDAASIYPLILYPDSPLARQINEGKRVRPGDLQREYEFFDALERTMLRQYAWRRFSPLHYGNKRRETSRYNGSRSLERDTLAIGPGAGGRIGKLAYMHSPDVNAYVGLESEGRMPRLMASEEQPLLDRMKRLFALPEAGFLSQEDYQWGAELIEGLGESFDAMSKLGLIVQTESGWELVREGRFWHYNLAWMLGALVEHSVHLLSEAKI